MWRTLKKTELDHLEIKNAELGVTYLSAYCEHAANDLQMPHGPPACLTAL